MFIELRSGEANVLGTGVRRYVDPPDIIDCQDGGIHVLRDREFVQIGLLLGFCHPSAGQRLALTFEEFCRRPLRAVGLRVVMDQIGLVSSHEHPVVSVCHLHALGLHAR